MLSWKKKVIQLTKVFKPVVRAWELLLSCVYRGGFSRVLKAEFLDLDCLGDNTSWVKKTKTEKIYLSKSWMTKINRNKFSRSDVFGLCILQTLSLSAVTIVIISDEATIIIIKHRRNIFTYFDDI